MISKVGPATGVEGSILERRKLFGEREYRVTLLEPPSFTRTPQSREFALTQGDPFSLVYEVEGSVPFRYRWYFRAAGADSPPRALAAGDGIAIDLGVGRSALKIAGLREQDEGEYFLVAENAAGREPAPGVSVEVFQPPELLSFLARDGEEKPRRIEAGGMEGGLAPLWVNEGEGLVLEAEVAGSGPISGIWKRLDDDTAPSRPVSEDPVPQDAVATLHLESATSEDAGQYQLTLGTGRRVRSRHGFHRPWRVSCVRGPSAQPGRRVSAAAPRDYGVVARGKRISGLQEMPRDGGRSIRIVPDGVVAAT